ncbi:MAG: hypothetical protein KU37_09175 [Sulfuricurvum sp. PC08-66]|nr:MAG: hypothetical protein KU37_09175 [Sulfuricurvum sp. PC08-66]
MLLCHANATQLSKHFLILQRYFPQLSHTTIDKLEASVDAYRYDMLIIDSQVPLEGESAAILERVLETHDALHCAIESDTSRTQQLQEALAIGFDTFLPSHLNTQDYYRRLARLLHRKHFYALHSLSQIEVEPFAPVGTNALLDTLTGLPNSEGLKRACANKSHRGLLFIDVDKFDSINTLYGMQIGDKVLQYLGKRLQRFLPDNAKLFHISADEFVVLVNYPRPDQVAQLGEQILALFAHAPIVIGNVSFDISLCAGYDEGDNYDIYYNAKLANREAKSIGGRRCVKYHAASYYLRQQQENHFWVNELKDAIMHERIHVYFQPIIDMRTNVIGKYEVLARMENRKGEIIAPQFFLKPAIQAKLITDISRMVIDKAFKFFSSRHYEFALNISEQDFKEGYLEEFLLHKCDYYDIAPSRVYLEILEDMSMLQADLFTQQMQSLQRHGFNFSIDDFGVEKSNYSRVLETKAQLIKIDGSFVRTLRENENSRIIVESIVSFAQKMGAKTVAEFVETQEALELVEKLGVDYAQGYLIGKPQAFLL